MRDERGDVLLNPESALGAAQAGALTPGHGSVAAEVESGAESPASAREDHDPARVISGHAVERIVETLDEFRRHCVQVVRPVEGEHRHAVSRLGGEDHGHGPGPYCAGGGGRCEGRMLWTPVPGVVGIRGGLVVRGSGAGEESLELGDERLRHGKGCRQDPPPLRAPSCVDGDDAPPGFWDEGENAQAGARILTLATSR